MKHAPFAGSPIVLDVQTAENRSDAASMLSAVQDAGLDAARPAATPPRSACRNDESAHKRRSARPSPRRNATASTVAGKNRADEDYRRSLELARHAADLRAAGLALLRRSAELSGESDAALRRSPSLRRRIGAPRA